MLSRRTRARASLSIRRGLDRSSQRYLICTNSHREPPKESIRTFSLFKPLTLVHSFVVVVACVIASSSCFVLNCYGCCGVSYVSPLKTQGVASAFSLLTVNAQYFKGTYLSRLSFSHSTFSHIRNATVYVTVDRLRNVHKK